MEYSAVATIVMAAGGSTRLGMPKQSLEFRGQTLLQRAVSTALQADIGPVYVVLGAQASDLRKKLEDLPISIIENKDWQRGMGSSLRAGVAAAAKSETELSGFLLMLCDQPFLTPEHLKSLAAKHRADALIVASRYSDKDFGPPVLFNRKFLSELISVPDDKGARPVMMRNASYIEFISFAGGIVDIDTPADLVHLQE
jgi:molybdenum cofactor cytidylyltransferase